MYTHARDGWKMKRREEREEDNGDRRRAKSEEEGGVSVGVEVLGAGDELVAVVEHRHARRHESPPHGHRLDVACSPSLESGAAYTQQLEEGESAMGRGVPVVVRMS
jgi:hypothetical protein